jgi:hypothetical protein
MLPGAVGKLADCREGFAGGVRDVGIGKIEHLAEHEHGPFLG